MDLRILLKMEDIKFLAKEQRLFKKKTALLSGSGPVQQKAEGITGSVFH